MELPRYVVVQHHNHLTLTLDFQGQFSKILYLRNGMPDWHGTKGMWVDWILDPCCDFQLWPYPWPWPWIFNVKFWNSCIPWIRGKIDMERKGYESIGCCTFFVTLSCDLDLGFSRSNFENAVSQEWEGQLTWNQRDVINRMWDSHCNFEVWPHPWPLPWIFKVDFLNNCISGTGGGSINMGQKGYESIRCYIYYVTLSYDFDLGFWRSNFKALS